MSQVTSGTSPHPTEDNSRPSEQRRSLKSALLSYKKAGLALTATTLFAGAFTFFPAVLEQMDGTSKVEPEILVAEAHGDAKTTLATEIPLDRIPDYSIDQFDYVSTHQERKQWKLVADRASLYHAENIVHARNITAYLYDAQDQVTVVTGKEAKYFVNQRNLEVFGDVQTVFPDGFQLYSDYLRYQPDRREVDIPIVYPVRGNSTSTPMEVLSFQSQGFFYLLDTGLVTLPEASRVQLTQKLPQTPEKSTRIISDRAVLTRSNQTAHYTMHASRPLKDRFVNIYQDGDGLEAKSRTAKLGYIVDPHTGTKSQLRHLTLYDDVFIKENPKNPADPPRYATAGEADLDHQKNLIILSEFPQVYQDRDTMTGDIILVHRDTDIVEVEYSNAFSAGAPAQPDSRSQPTPSPGGPAD